MNIITCEWKEGSTIVDVGVVVDRENGFFGYKESVCVRVTIFCKEGAAGRTILIAEMFPKLSERLILEE